LNNRISLLAVDLSKERGWIGITLPSNALPVFLARPQMCQLVHRMCTAPFGLALAQSRDLGAQSKQGGC
jgi:hypothetical protein